MNNTTRHHTEERRDRDNLGNQTAPPPQAPAAADSAHVPGGATEMAELGRTLQPPTGKPATDKTPPTP